LVCLRTDGRIGDCPNLIFVITRTDSADGPLLSERLELEPLRPDHADELAPVLDDIRLHTFIGGRPATAAELRDRYTRQVVGRSPDGSERWLNWVVRHRKSGQAVGTTQATISAPDGRVTASVAWVIAIAYQQQGYAKEAALVMVQWLRQHGVESFVADVHPRHTASMAVARAIGLVPTDTVVDGEVRWR
jgi:RimJ/RimL family protein N-acetyltransferase